MNRDEGALVARVHEERLGHASQLWEIRSNLYNTESVRRRCYVPLLGAVALVREILPPINYDKRLFPDISEARAEKRRR